MTRKTYEFKRNAARAKKECLRIAAEINRKRSTLPEWCQKNIDRNQRLGVSLGC